MNDGSLTNRICGTFDPPDVTDLGCCAPMVTKRSCEAPVLPVPACGETSQTVIYSPDTGIFTILNTLFDSNCSALLDSTGSPLLALAD
jgi:hypothetical protein